MVNNNLINMYSTQGEFKGVLNSIGQRQNDLIKKMALLMERSTFNKEEGSKARRPQFQIPEFSPSSAGYRFELMNMNLPPKYDRKGNDLPCFFHLFYL